MALHKRGQVEVTFNWIYIVIAGAVILLFFFGIVMKQKQVSEEQLSGEVVQIMSSILTGAGVSEKTKNVIDASGLADYILYFDCIDGVSEFGIKSQPARTQNGIDPIFAPKEVQSSRIVTWSLPYHMPFKVIDFLFIIPSNVKYIITGSDAKFIDEFLNSTEGIDREFTLNPQNANVQGKKQVRIIYTDSLIVPGTGVPASLSSFLDVDVSAVSFNGNLINFYQKNGNAWKKLNNNPIRLVSLGGERDAAKHAAIFSGDDKTYQCNMGKAFKRLDLLLDVYGGPEIGVGSSGGKLAQLIDHYKEIPTSECKGHLEDYDINARDIISTLKNKASACKLQAQSCLEMISAAQKMKGINEQLQISCKPLY
ncbi:MAG: hypothetical protein AABX05_00130 [Nanoarchaeota archaeon]